jgi:hypothetical protein
MPTEYESLVTAMKALTQGEEPNTVTLPVAEYDWKTRPNADSYGTIALEFEADALEGDNIKQVRAFEGSVDLWSHQKRGSGWIALIEAVLTEHCESAWTLNYHAYERETGLFHWEWSFQIEG